MELSENTQAIVLLTAPLLLGRSSERFKVLTPSEYKKLAHFLLNLKRTPADLLKDDGLIHACSGLVEEERLRTLLGRGLLLAQALERWQVRGIWGGAVGLTKTTLGGLKRDSTTMRRRFFTASGI